VLGTRSLYEAIIGEPYGYKRLAHFISAHLLVIIRYRLFMQKIINRGFTLIELLVVIAIIGILASIVLVSLGNARQKGADAGIQGNLDSIRTQAEVYSSNNNGNYAASVVATTTVLTTGTAATSCGTAGLWTDPTIAAATKAAAVQAGGPATLNGTANAYAVCGAGPTWWAIAVVQKVDSSKTWCVDSTGRAKQTLVSDITGANTFTGCI